MSHIKDRLTDYHDFMDELADYHQMIPASDVLKIIDELQGNPEQDEKENGWISVSERLPEGERECLVTLEKIYGTPEISMGIANYLRFGNDGYWNEKKYGYLEWDKYSDGHGGTKIYKVIAWMPLPEPYKEDKEDEQPET